METFNRILTEHTDLYPADIKYHQPGDLKCVSQHENDCFMSKPNGRFKQSTLSVRKSTRATLFFRGMLGLQGQHESSDILAFLRMLVAGTFYWNGAG